MKVLGVGKMNFTRGDPALMLKYQTDLDLSNKPELKKEVEEIWQLFRVDVEKVGLKAAIVSANEVPKGMLIKTSKSYNFVYKKNGDGSWRSMTD